ncbi:MAG: phosphoglycerate transporter [Chloroflexi bacterium]|nr:phosphoglycerate transporter [Chloroflexota bacterium]
MAGSLDAEIAVVFCNRKPGEDPNTDSFLEQVRAYGLPLVCLSSRDFRRARGKEPVRKGDPLPKWRADYDRELIRLLEPHPFDLGVLAGYMLIFSSEPSNRWDLLNLHPAAPGGPKGMWQDVIWELIATRAERAGVMLHLATPELDEGPPVTYCTYPIRGDGFDRLWQAIEGTDLERLKESAGESNELFAEIRRHGVAHEIPLVIETLRAFADRRLRISDKQVLNPKGRSVPGHDLTDQIERAVASALA